MVRPSPFEQVHLQLGAQLGEYHGWRLPSQFEGFETEKAALRNQCVAFDLCGFGRFSLKGADCKELLTRMGYGSVPEFGSEKWVWSNGDSTIVSRVAAVKGEYILLSPPAQTKLLYDQIKEAVFDHNLDVQIIDLSEKTAFLGLYGPQSYNSLIRLLPFEIEEIAPGGAIPVSFFMMNFILLRGSWLNTEGLELICPVSAAGLVGGSIAKYRQKYNITPGGMDCLLSAIEDSRK